LEDFLTDDVASNFVEHFYTDEPFQPGGRRYVRGADTLDDLDMEYLSIILQEDQIKRTT